MQQQSGLNADWLKGKHKQIPALMTEREFNLICFLQASVFMSLEQDKKINMTISIIYFS